MRALKILEHPAKPKKHNNQTAVKSGSLGAPPLGSHFYLHITTEYPSALLSDISKPALLTRRL